MLVVDDEHMILSVIHAILEQHADVVCATNPADAERLLLDGEDFHVVLCDLDLGATSGADLHDTIEKADPSVAKRFVFMTGWADPFASFLERIGNRYLLKPFDPQDLVGVLNDPQVPSTPQPIEGSHRSLFQPHSQEVEPSNPRRVIRRQSLRRHR